MTTIPPDRSIEPQAEPCATHEAVVMLIVRASVQEGTTEAHVIEYISAHLENRDPDLHEDIFDELEGLAMSVHGRGKGAGRLLTCAAALIASDTANAIPEVRAAS